MMQYLPDAEHMKRMTTDELRQSFLLQGLFRAGRVTLRFVDLDRVIVGGIVPEGDALELTANEETARESFTARREVGLLNIGGEGMVDVDGTSYDMAPLDGLYIGRGSGTISLTSTEEGNPAAFYLVSYPAHAAHPTVRIRREDAEELMLGRPEKANRRLLRKYVRPGVVESAQLVMGCTNPFAESTTISFSLDRGADVTITIYDATGREVARLADGYKGAGVHELTWDARSLSNGVYFCHMVAAGYSSIKNVVRLP